MAVLHIFRGLPGSGKSTEAKKLDIPHYEADMYHMVDGKYKFDASKLGFAHDCCKNAVEYSLNNDKDCVVSNTFTTKKEIAPYVEIAKRGGHDIKLKTMTKNYGNIHDVPQEAIERMRDRFVPHDEVMKHFDL